MPNIMDVFYIYVWTLDDPLTKMLDTTSNSQYGLWLYQYKYADSNHTMISIKVT